MNRCIRVGVAAGVLSLIAVSTVLAQETAGEGLDAVERRIEAHAYQEARETLLRWKETEAGRASPGVRARARYLEAVLEGDPVAAERLFLGVAVDHPSAPEAADALLRVGQSRYAAGEHERARTVFDRLLHDYPDSEARVRGAYWAIVNHLAGGREADACAALNRVRASESEALRERLDHLDLRCSAASDPGEIPPIRAGATSDDDRRPAVVEAGPFPTTEEAVAVRDRLTAAGLPAFLVRRAVEEGTRVWVGDPGPRAERLELADRVRALGVDVTVTTVDSDG